MTTDPDVARWRAETPGTVGVAHLNNAGAALPTRAVLDAVIGHLRLEAEIGGYEAEAAAAPALARTRAAVAELLGADPDDVAITTSDSAGFTKAWWGFVLGGGLAAGGRVLVDRTTYGSHYLALRQAAAHVGARIEIIGSEPDGTIDLVDLERRIRDATVVSVAHVPTHRGLVQPVAEVGRLAREAGAWFFLDACQSMGQLPLAVDALGCDVLTGTGRKFLRGPRGTGVLWVRRPLAELMEPHGIDGTSASWLADASYELGAAARRFDEFEASIAGRIGLGVAIDQALTIGIDRIAERIGILAAALRHGLGEVPGVVLRDGGRQQCGIVTWTMADAEPAAVRAAASNAGVNISVSAASWARLDMGPEGPADVVRASPHAYNDESDLERLLAVVSSLA